jgi:hypothetical protein
MGPGADVRAIDSLREWQSALQIYAHEAGEALGGINMEIRRAFDWIEEQRALWERAVRTCEEEVVQAKAELASRKFPNWDGKIPDTTVQERNLRRAQARLEHAHERVASCRTWAGRLPKLVEETYSSRGHRLQNFLESEVARSLATIAVRIQALDQYAGLQTDYRGSSDAPSAGGAS